MTTSNTTEIDLGVDPDLQNLMDDLVSGFSGPDVEPDPDAVWATLTEVGLARLTAPAVTWGVPLGSSDVRTRHRVTVVGIRKSGGEFTHADKETIPHRGDEIIISGSVKAVERFSALPDDIPG